MSSSQSVIEARAVGFEIDGTKLISDLSCSLQSGSLVALVGPNGAGKSTLLGLLAGDSSPSSGEILVDGKPIAQWPSKELARRRAVMLQSADVRFGFSVTEMVEMARLPHPVDKERDAEIVADSIVAAEITHLQHRSVTTLSGGESARTNFARTLAQTTPIMLLDEPTAALDLRHQEVLLGKARALAQEGCLVVIVVHDLNLAARYADRVLMLKGGHLVADGTPDQVLTAEQVEDVYEQKVLRLRHPETGAPLIVPVG